MDPADLPQAGMLAMEHVTGSKDPRSKFRVCYTSCVITFAYIFVGYVGKESGLKL
jgi:hypothetical protein